MNFNFLGRVSRLAAIGAILLGSASCVDINEELGENFIPTDQKWDVFTPDAIDLKEVRMQMSDSLSGYSTTRFTFGAVNDSRFGKSVKSTSFTLVPLYDTLDFGKNMKIRQFHFTAVRDTLSVVKEEQLKVLQNVHVSELKKALDSTVLYMGAFMNPEIRAEYLNTEEEITVGTPVYDGGDSLSFDFSKEFAERFVEKVKKADLDSMDLYIEQVPGIYITTDLPAGEGGRINMFNLSILTADGYVSGNYAQLKFTAEYDHSDEPVDTSFLFFFGPADFMDDNATEYPTQFAFNASSHETFDNYKGDGALATDKIYIEGGSGIKPVVKATEIKRILNEQIALAGITDPSEVVINKATIILPYEVEGGYNALDKYPMILSPTVRLRSSEGGYVSYAGLTDSSIESENQGDINRSLSLYSPDVSHHIQEILKLDENDKDYAKDIEKYDIWFLIMHEEIKQSSSSNNSMNDYYQNLMYNSYYNSMMYDPYGYGYGYGGYGYGSNYYNYYMMAMYASSYGNNSSSNTSSIELDKDRYYYGVLNGPEAAGAKPQIKITFSAPKNAEK